MIDIHIHILPGLDDGPATLEESLAMARKTVQSGVDTVIATPHIANGLYLNNKNNIIEAVKIVSQHLEKHGIPLTVLPGSEVRLSPDVIDGVDNNEIITLNDSGHYLLLELPDQLPVAIAINFINRLSKKGITAIIAHAERNISIQRDIKMLKEMHKAGALCQVTGGSLLGAFGGAAKKCCITIIKERLADFIASDAHSAQVRPPNLDLAFRKACSLAGNLEAERLMITGPSMILNS
ncbi:MAG: CpsB/CapC family capsule biosynthesis tyrosine phosphatase [Pseudomonadota bacterium]